MGATISEETEATISEETEQTRCEEVEVTNDFQSEKEIKQEEEKLKLEIKELKQEQKRKEDEYKRQNHLRDEKLKQIIKKMNTDLSGQSYSGGNDIKGIDDTIRQLEQIVEKNTNDDEKIRVKERIPKIPFVNGESVFVVEGKQKGKYGKIQTGNHGNIKIAIGVDVEVDRGKRKALWMPINYLQKKDKILENGVTHSNANVEISHTTLIQKKIMLSTCVEMTNLTETQQMKIITTNQQEILPFLHLGDYEAFKEIGTHNQESFAVVVKVTHQAHDDPKNTFYYNPNLPKTIKLYDIGKGLGDVNESWIALSKSIDKILPKITQHMKAKERILVHCTQGVSRSPTVVIAYLMWRYHVPYDKAFAFVQSKRLQIDPKQGFVEGLKAKYTDEEVINDQNQVKKIKLNR